MPNNSVDVFGLQLVALIGGLMAVCEQCCVIINNNKHRTRMRPAGVHHHPKEWEGFQYIHEAYDHIQREDICCRTVVKESCRLPTRQASLRVTPREEVGAYICPERPSEQLPKIQQKKPTNRREAEPVRRQSPKRKAPTQFYPQIKILKIPCPMEESGVMVYKSGISATSDRLLNHLRDVNFEEPMSKDMHIRDITFGSKFESGNLCCAYKIMDGQYTLHIRADTNTLGHRQWYYFSVRNKKAGTIRFNIRQFLKPVSLYCRGMKPYVLSKKQFQQNGANWKQQGENVRYRKNHHDETKRSWYLTFDYTFTHDHDQVYFAACPPYSYSHLLRQLNEFPKVNTKCRLQVNSLGKSLCGLEIPLMTISHPNYDGQATRNFIVIMSRTHPGESASSWVMNGILKYFIGQDISMDNYPSNLVFKLIPMVNVDGVFLGNYRTGVIGKDFNRKFVTGAANIFPEISHIKRLVKQLKKQGRVLSIVDLHGHSVQKNSFVFGPQSSSVNSSLGRLPEELAKHSAYFKLSSCRFRGEPEGKLKETARGYFQEKENLLALTIENSLGLYCKASDRLTYPMQTADWERFGGEVAQAILRLSPSESESYEFSNLKKTQPINFYRLENKASAPPAAPSRPSIESIIRQTYAPHHKVNATVRSGGRLPDGANSDKHMAPLDNSRCTYRFKSTEKTRKSQPNTSSIESEASKRINIREILMQAQKASAKYQAVTPTSKFGASSQPKLEHPRRTIRNTKRTSRETSVEETIKQDFQKRIIAALEETKPTKQEPSKIDLDRISDKDNSDANDSDGDEEDLPEAQWEELQKDVLEIVNNSALEQTSPRRETQLPQQKPCQPAKLSLPVKKKPEVVPPNGFREMRFTLSKFYPRKPHRLETLERLAELYPGDISNHEKPRTQPSLIEAEKYLSEQLSVFSGGKLVQPSHPTALQKRVSIFNQRHVLDRMKVSLGGAPLAKYFKRKL